MLSVQMSEILEKPPTYWHQRLVIVVIEYDIEVPFLIVLAWVR
jgi:hypothetical protein